MSDSDSVDEADWAFLVQNGIMKTKFEMEGVKGFFKCATQVVWLENLEIKNELLTIGDRIKEKHKTEFEALKTPYVKAVLDATPKQVLTMQKYGLQYIFFSDGWFLLHCMKELVNNGKLKLPTEEQKKSLTTLIVPNS